jgi:hypothetical protein
MSIKNLHADNNDLKNEVKEMMMDYIIRLCVLFSRCTDSIGAISINSSLASLSLIRGGIERQQHNFLLY